LSQQYDVTTIAVRPGTHPKALAILGKSLISDTKLLACWYSEIGTINQILLIRDAAEPATILTARYAALNAANPFGLREFITGLTIDTYASFDFIAPMRPGALGPVFEVRNYVLKPDGLAPTVELWRKAVPDRSKISPLLAAMISVTGAAKRFMHIWPYRTLDERTRLRDKAAAEGVWPPPGGPGHIASQQVDIYLPAPFSPMR
jgi:NIPSNAP